MPSRRRLIIQGLDHSFRAFTASLRARPDFIIVGAQKAGTTSLFDYLCENPFLHGSSVKEVRYFDRNYSKGLQWYQRHFDLSWTGLRFEASPSYLLFPEALERIRTDLPRARIIVLLRDPVARTYSHYQHNRRHKDREDRSFQEAVLADKTLFEKEGMPISYTPEVSMYSYVRRSIYAPQVRKCFDTFGRDNVLVLFSERMFADPQLAVNEIADFVRVPRHRIIDASPRNVGTYKDNGLVAEELREFFRPYDEELFDLLGMDPCWEPAAASTVP